MGMIARSAEFIKFEKEQRATVFDVVMSILAVRLKFFGCLFDVVKIFSRSSNLKCA